MVLTGMTSKCLECLPFFASGPVVKGFGRGSKCLGIPTANFPDEVVQKLPDSVNCGIYYGFANVDYGPVYKMVMSVGWNPFYKNEKKSMETHILHEFENDFYGSLLKVVILGYIRPEKDFKSVDDLVAEIKNDIDVAEKKLKEPEYVEFQDHSFFRSEDNQENQSFS